MKLKKGLALLLGAALAIGLIAGCGSDQSGSAGNADANKEKTITFAAEMTYPPFEYAEGDQYKGFDIDLANAIAKQMGYKAKWVSMGFDALIPALEAKQIDAVASGMVITPERLQKINFTDPYYQVRLVMVIRNDENNVKVENDIDGKVVGAQIGTTGAMLAKKHQGTTVKEFDTIPNMLTDLQNGNLQIVMLDEPVAKYYIQKMNMGNLKIVDLGLQNHELGIGVRKADKELLDKMNAALKTLKENGEYAKLQQKWFGDIK